MKYFVCSLLFTITLPPALVGGFFTLLLFALCFALTHFCKLAFLGWKKGKPQEEPPIKEEKKEEKQTPTPSEPVYYIVERKKRRAKAEYSPPKEIRFK